MNSVAEDVKDMLESSAKGALGTLATDLFVGMMPESPYQCIALFDTGGGDPEPHYDYFRPGLQALVRGKKGQYREAYELAGQVRDALNGVYNETWNGTRYVGIWAQGDVLFISWDDNNCPLFSVNFRVHRTQ